MKAISLRLEPAQYERLHLLSLFCQDMSHPSLAIERIEGYPGVWAGHVSQKYRWTFHFEEHPETGQRVCVHRGIQVPGTYMATST